MEYVMYLAQNIKVKKKTVRTSFKKSKNNKNHKNTHKKKVTS